MDIAVIAAHMDDEILGCGGTIARYNIEDHNIHVLVLTESCSAGHLGTTEIVTNKKAEFLAAMEMLGGYKSYKICEFPDMQLDTVSHLDLNRAIESFIDEVQPEMVFTHHPGDINMDHCKVFESTMVAVRPVPSCPVKKVLCYEVPGNAGWSGLVTQPFIPNTHIDISDTLHIKLEAVEIYKSELRVYPHPRSIRNIINYACARGSEVSIDAAEAFMLIRIIE